VNDAARAAGRNPSEIKLLAVSKTMGAEIVRSAYEAGQREFAENRVQEWLEKVTLLPADCHWHIIGRLQSNKVKYLNSQISLIHSLDRMSLLEELEHQGEIKGIIWPALVQVNIAQDDNKAGILENEVEDFLDAVALSKHIRVHGFMTIGALEANPEETREFFRKLRQLKERLQNKHFPNIELKELSMGMSRDFECAIQEGATMVRVGSQIFGQRI
jgi:pyridoxal phosphate enzyme (YggS family)